MRFSVFTPTYNRLRLLPRVIESLQSQTCADFEWIVVDDGSSDHTAEFLADFAATAPFPVRVIISPTNRGKHVAWNTAVRQARGELFVIADSDDGFVPESLERMAAIWLSIPSDQRADFSGVTVLCKDSQTSAVTGDPFPESPLDSNQLALRFVHRILGEKWGCVRTDLLREIPFPELPGSHFAENYVWYRLARRYQTRCVNEPMRIFYNDRRADRLTWESRVSIPASRFEAGYLWNTIHLNENLDYLWRAPRELLTTTAHLGLSGRILRRPAIETCSRLRSASLRFLFWALYPLSMYLYKRDRAQQRFQVDA